MKTTPYDKIPYTKHIYQQTQPNNLATIATLFGMPPPPVETCRVLELGCASGINILAMAQAIPNGEFVGIELSAQQIQEGQNNIRQLGLQNITLKQMDILDISAELGKFDYIVAHGVYSWVPPNVRGKILQICRHQLQPNGVAYVSYNVLPGWHIEQTLREMMLYRTKHLTDPTEKLKQAKALLNFFVDTLKPKYDSYSLSLRKELHRVSQLNENYFFHEYLEDNNEAVFFYEFIEHATQNGLQYITDTTATFASLENFLEGADKLGMSLIEKEQYFDFLRNTQFRATLLCHQQISLNRNLVADKLSDFYIAAPLKPASQNQSTAAEISEKLKHEMLERFDNLAGEAVLSVASPLLKAVCLCLGEVWPQSLPFDSLMLQVYKLLRLVDRERGKEKQENDGTGEAETGQRANGRAQGPGGQGPGKLDNKTEQTGLSPEEIDEVKTMLLAFYLKNIVELSVYPPQFTLNLSEHPLASPIARLQSEQGKQVTNLRYEEFSLGFVTRQVLKHLDGTHDRAALVEVLRKSIENGELTLYQGEGKKALAEIGSEELHHYLSQQVQESLRSLANKAYLIA
jgi:methyltransferase-like protein/SAM-dependent methyltransferase